MAKYHHGLSPCELERPRPYQGERDSDYERDVARDKEAERRYHDSQKLKKK